MKTQTAKQVQVLNRYELKSNGKPNGYVVYEVKSSNGVDTYKTTLKDGLAKSCTCPSYKPCYHMTQLQEREAQRVNREAEKQAYREFEFQCGHYSIPGLY